LWEEIPVVLWNEAYTSITCHRCGAIGTVKKRLFVCPHCGEYNRDLNAAINIGNRFLGYILRNSGALAHCLTPTLNSTAGRSSGLLEATASDGRISRL
jgi:transposase